MHTHTLALLHGEAIWRVSEKDPVEYTFQAIPGCSLVNPVAYGAFYTGSGREHVASRACLDDGTLLLWSDTLFFTTADRPSERELLPLLAHLRIVSQQASLPRALDGTFPCSTTPPGAGVVIPTPFPSSRRGYMRTVKEDAVETALSFARLNEADKRLASAEPLDLPVELFLDAIEAERYADAKKAVLFAGIAVEVLEKLRKRIHKVGAQLSARRDVLRDARNDIAHEGEQKHRPGQQPISVSDALVTTRDFYTTRGVRVVYRPNGGKVVDLPK